MDQVCHSEHEVALLNKNILEAHNMELATLILGLRHGVFVDRSIFRFT